MKGRISLKFLPVVLTLFILLWGSAAQAAIFYATADAKVQLGSDTNYGDQNSAVVGRDTGSTVGRLYVGFSLPDLPAGHEFASATLYGYYYWDTWDSTDRGFSWHMVAETHDVWNEMAITGNNAPAYSGSAIATWTPTGTSSGASGHAYNEWQNWDILSAVASDTDGIMTLVLKQTDEGLAGGYESFRTKEYSDGSYGFYIEYTTRPVPAPGALVLLSSGLAGLCGLRRRFMRG